MISERIIESRMPPITAILEQGEIEVHQPVPDERVPAQVPAERNRIWDREAL
jgi:hypothetical protein